MASILVTLFQLRPVPETLSVLSMSGQVSFERPWPLGK